MSNFPLQKLEAARVYSTLGWPMIPTKGKIPYLTCWQNKATTEELIFSKWFQGTRNIALVMGPQAGIVALDVDPRNGGDQSIKQLETKLGKLPKTVTAKTGGGGYHYLFQYFDGGKNCKPALGIDFQYNNKLIIACPSIHPNTGAVYEWEISPLEFKPAELPNSWIQHLSEKITDTPAPENSSVEQRLSLYTGDILKGERNETLFKLGCSLRARGVTRTALTAEIQEANLLRCKPPLPDLESYRIIESVLAYKAKNKSLKTQWQENIIRDKLLDAKAKVIAIELSLFADENGRSCWPNQNQIAENIGFSRNTVAKYLNLLVSSGKIGRYIKGREGKGFSYGYILTLENAQL